MKTSVIALFLCMGSLLSCEQAGTKIDAFTPTADTNCPVMTLIGKAIDTAYLYATYMDPGATAVDDVDKAPNCDNRIRSTGAGMVNTRLPGTYFLTYQASDAAGNQAAALTRTVYVVENGASFLNGFYTVACSCTAGATGSPNPSVTAESYTAIVTSGSANNHFDLSALRIGSERVMGSANLSGNAIEVGYFSPDYASSSGSGTLSATKNTFTIVNTAYPFSPALIYVCRNVYTKQLIIAENKHK